MAVKSRDFVGIAEGIRSHELSTKSQIEILKGHMSELSGRRSSLNSTISYLEAAIAAAYEDTDEDGDPDYRLIASLEAEKGSAENELSGVEQDLDSTGSELESKQNELEAVEEEKAQTLFEIQERARKTSQNISLAGGMYGSYAGVGSTLQNSLQTSLSSLTQAADILGGSVAGATVGSVGNSSFGSDRSSSGETGTSSGVGNTETGALSAFTGGYSGETLSLPASQFSTRQDQLSTPAAMPNFHSGQGTINTKAPQSFTSEQNANAYALDSFAASPEDALILPGVTEYLSGQESQLVQCAFKSKNSQTKPNSGKTSVYEDNYRSAQETQGFSGFIDATKTAPMIARHGRNPFIDSLIVQDWELGRYSDSTMSSFRKQAAQSDYAAYIKNPSDYRHISYDKKPVIYIDPATINEIRGISDPNFWSYKSTPYSRYIDMARQIPLVYSMAKAGQKLTDLARRDDVIGACVRNYFLNDDITVMRVGNGYVFGGEGRHRIMAALIAGVNIPVRVTDDFIKNENSPSIAKKELETLTGKERASRFRKDFASRSVTVSQKIAHANKRELVDLVKNERIAKKVDFGEMDINVAREFVDTIWRAKSKYSFLDFPFIGSTQSLNDNLRQNIQINLTRLYVQNNPTVPIDEITAIVQTETNAYMKQFEIGENDLAVSITVKTPQRIVRPKPGMESAGYITEYVGDTFSSRLNGISINTDNAKDYTVLCQDLLKEEQRGASPKGCVTVRYLINHEIAHQLDNVLNLSEDPIIIREYVKHIQMSESEQISNLCTYASKDIHEFIAEAWAESQSSSSPRSVAKLIGDKVESAAKAYINAKKGVDDYVRELEP